MTCAFSPFQQDFSHIRTMVGCYERHCSEASFRFGENLSSSRTRTRDSVVRSRLRKLLNLKEIISQTDKYFDLLS